MPDSFFKLDDNDRRELLEVAASRLGRRANLLEKDVWVVQLLGILFSSPYAPHLVFKGGTALSKAYKVIDRFSEDVDVTYDIRELVGHLVELSPGQTHGFDIIPKNRSQQSKITKLVREALPGWIVNQMQPLVMEKLSGISHVETEIIGEHSDCLLIKYPSVTVATDYAPATVRLEFGARSTGEPASVHHIACDMAEYFPQISFPLAQPRTMEISRIFWEKSTAMHVYSKQGEKHLQHRFSRHLHDIARLKITGHADAAIASREVALTVAQHKAMFFREKANGQDVDYCGAVQGSLQLVPEGPALEALRRDYEQMISEGLLYESAQSFDELAAVCLEIQAQANQVSTT
jgi:hypothetical protein